MFSKKKEKNLLFSQVVLPVANLALPHELAFILYSLLYWLSSKFIIIAILIIAMMLTDIDCGNDADHQHHCHNQCQSASLSPSLQSASSDNGHHNPHELASTLCCLLTLIDSALDVDIAARQWYISSS